MSCWLVLKNLSNEESYLQIKQHLVLNSVNSVSLW